MSALRDTILVLEDHEARLVAVEEGQVAFTKYVDDFEKRILARIAQSEQTTSGLLVILRDGITEECRLLREGINRARR